MSGELSACTEHGVQRAVEPAAALLSRLPEQVVSVE
jgi:hypothetical protein